MRQKAFLAHSETQVLFPDISFGMCEPLGVETYSNGSGGVSPAISWYLLLARAL